jgi:hypothetical protein
VKPMMNDLLDLLFTNPALLDKLTNRISFTDPEIKPFSRMYPMIIRIEGYKKMSTAGAVILLFPGSVFPVLYRAET